MIYEHKTLSEVIDLLDGAGLVIDDPEVIAAELKAEGFDPEELVPFNIDERN